MIFKAFLQTNCKEEDGEEALFDGWMGTMALIESARHHTLTTFKEISAPSEGAVQCVD